jgi:hypothetical protein
MKPVTKKTLHRLLNKQLKMRQEESRRRKMLFPQKPK